jgi:hypothetical protein
MPLLVSDGRKTKRKNRNHPFLDESCALSVGWQLLPRIGSAAKVSAMAAR